MLILLFMLILSVYLVSWKRSNFLRQHWVLEVVMM